ncbi:MAG TPA: hypothetical protein VE974_06215 [Thermoanaerobaculia bacterium]|nr:hypothetical protein [Thermoanaerobaculia bacterium]
MSKYKVDFAALKARVGLEAICHHYGIVLKRSKDSSWVSGDCPLPQHTAETKGSLKINLENEKWHCKSASCVEARDGKPGGDLINFVAWKENVNYRKAGELIAEWFPETPWQVAPVEVVEAPPAVMRPEVVEVKAERYMEELDRFLRELLTVPENMTVADWKEKVIKALKRRVLESFRAGKEATA